MLWKATFELWMYTLKNIPMIFWLKPRVLELDTTRSVIVIPFRRRTRNHLNSMYFGALCVGADLAPGLLTMTIIKSKRKKCSFIFKDFQSNFVRRCEADAKFICEEGHLITKAIDQAVELRERQDTTLSVTAVESTSGEVVAEFKMTISIKYLEK